MEGAMKDKRPGFYWFRWYADDAVWQPAHWDGNRIYPCHGPSTGYSVQLANELTAGLKAGEELYEFGDEIAHPWEQEEEIPDHAICRGGPLNDQPHQLIGNLLRCPVEGVPDAIYEPAQVPSGKWFWVFVGPENELHES